MPATLIAIFALANLAPVEAADNTPPPGFVALFNGKDLTGWKGLVKPPLDSPAQRAKMHARSNWPRPRRRPTR